MSVMHWGPCPRCGDDLEWLSTTNEWEHYCPQCDRRFNGDGVAMDEADKPNRKEVAVSAGKHPQRDRDVAREPVRRGQLNTVLGRFHQALNQDFGLKTATALTKYHVTQIEPRFQRLEKLPWNWLAFRVMDGWMWVRATVTVLWRRLHPKPVAEPTSDAQDTQQAPEPQSEPEPIESPAQPILVTGDDNH